MRKLLVEAGCNIARELYLGLLLDREVGRLTFIVSPETNLTLGYRLTRRLEATIGYSYLGLPKVARVADQLDPQLASNLSNPPTGASTPSFSLRESNYSLHSLDYGLQWRY